MSHERAVHDPQPTRGDRDDDQQRGGRGPVPRSSWLPRHRPTRWLILAVGVLPLALLAGGFNGASLVGTLAAAIYIVLLIAETTTTTKGTRP